MYSGLARDVWGGCQLAVCSDTTAVSHAPAGSRVNVAAIELNRV